MSESSSPREPFWRNPSGAQIIAAIIGLIGAVLVAVITTRDTSGPPPVAPQLTSTRENREAEDSLG